MELLGENPPLNLHNRRWPIRTATYSDPPSTLLCTKGDGVVNCLVAEGRAVLGGRVRRSVLGRNVVADRDSLIEEAIINDDAEIGEGARVRRTILDKGAVVPPGTRIGYDREADRQRYQVSETGIIVVPWPPLRSPKRSARSGKGQSAEAGPHHSPVTKVGV